MLTVSELTTPSFLVELTVMEENVKEAAAVCEKGGKQLCPMVKTHKSVGIAALQKKYGVSQFLVGTLDEAEKLAEHGFSDFVLAYPVAANENIARVLCLASKVHVTVCFDGFEAAQQMQQLAGTTNQTMDYLLIVDCGLHRFGVQAEQAVELVRQISALPNLRFKGISTHPGHVYGVSSHADIARVAKEEVDTLERAKTLLTAAGFLAEVVATGSTPTMAAAAQNDTVTTLRPGNYVFYDAIQIALGVVPEERCALTVLATVIANPSENLFMIDAGSKCFGLDKGAHSASLVNGYGVVKQHPELVIEGLSEEVGKIRANGETNLKVGDKIEVIPNHACAAANMTDFLVGHRKGVVERLVAIDARGGSAHRETLKNYE